MGDAIVGLTFFLFICFVGVGIVAYLLYGNDKS